uniref:EF-hand domain-containing protein n=1 Tax=Noctiluca scintillans TaxID=2966 RepID=A0A7S1ACM5_NOCSC|mmetsp:Transcript_4103/g.11548  ORF Transcript_4103/g.11548 Transcript_4103/m.11548 type:complete len:489 (+) Transcript_4103:118-1584(+)|eukprot:CAMPEP_0194532472 /NCGR_PEP_ID=MMETSP0253-20130528/70041_1 /TAXON_ID=2966 /ORGANISM="Noctiluca scintillans" /LENGTH=488 /DNA_ID=CAMNT_0039377923 /DNA_START=52 /DNA_END=1518 /DNA_ORIENTATION=+
MDAMSSEEHIDAILARTATCMGPAHPRSFSTRLTLIDSIAKLQTELREHFRDFDVDGRSGLNAQELKKAFASLCLPCDEQDLDTLLHSQADGCIGVDDFVLFCILKELQLWSLFRRIDRDSDGTVSLEDCTAGLRELGWHATVQNEDIMRCFDLRRGAGANTKLDYQEWRQLMADAPPAARSWNDIFHTLQMSVGANGDTLRPSRARETSGLVDLTAGFIAGCVSRTLTAPAERVKTELQLQTSRDSFAAVCRRVFAEGGCGAFFQGNWANCIKVAPQSALFFALTDLLKRRLPTAGDPSKAKTHSFLAGSLAGAASQFLIYPLEPIKTCLTVAPRGRYDGILSCARHLVKQDGVRALYRGCVPTLAACVPYAGVQRLVYDRLKLTCAWYGGTSAPAASFACGLVSSALGMSISYPLILIRTRMQVQGPHHSYTGFMDCAHRAVSKEGYGVFVKGLGPNLMKAAPAAAITFVLYDWAKDTLNTLPLAD